MLSFTTSWFVTVQRNASVAGRNELIAKLPKVGRFINNRPALDDLALKQAYKPGLSPNHFSL
jgi:hypothetical protein